MDLSSQQTSHLSTPQNAFFVGKDRAPAYLHHLLARAPDHLNAHFAVRQRKGEGLRPDFTMLLSIVILAGRAHPSIE
jgi:hypothetical protein